MSSKEACDGCKFYRARVRHLTDHPHGLCRIKAPLFVPLIGKVWPMVEADDWCGEFKWSGKPKPVERPYHKAFPNRTDGASE